MTYLTAFLLGLVQGVAEFLPISSSGHLAIAQNLLPEWGLAIVAVGLFASMMAWVDSMIHCISAMLSVDIYKRALAAAVLAVIVTVAVSLFTKPVDPAVLNRMKGLKAEG